jgi:hypothetical protein
MTHILLYTGPHQFLCNLQSAGIVIKEKAFHKYDIMKRQSFLFLAVILTSVLFSWTMFDTNWKVKTQNGYDIYYSTEDQAVIEDYTAMFENGKQLVTDFFQRPYKHHFDIHVHATRASLDSSWQTDWNMPEFYSQCWMVASGVADKFDIISPRMWDSIACEHSYADSIETQRLIAHELTHVFHGQNNLSPDFSDVHGIDWFVEGLATCVSGQCDSTRMSEVRTALNKDLNPNNLEEFWKGNFRYGLSGSMVMYIDSRFGKEILTSLLPFNTLDEILETLKISENELILGWNQFMTEN